MANENPQPNNENPPRYLGKVIDHFPIRCQPLNRWLALILGILLILDALIFGLIKTFNIVNAIQSHGRSVILARFSDPIFALCLILPLGIILIILAALNWQNGLTLHANGFLLRRFNRKIIWLWMDIKRFDNQITCVKFSGSVIGKQRKIILENDHQNRLRIRNSYERMDELVDDLRKSILPKLFSRSRKQMQAGETFSFHKHLQGSLEGVQIKETLFTWEEIHIAINKKGLLVISLHADQEMVFKSRTKSIKNLDVLLYLQENPPNSR